MKTTGATRATAQAMPSTFHTTALKRANHLVAFIDKVMEPQPLLSPDERIAAAIEEIKLAYREKWPDKPIYVRDLDNIDTGMVLIMTCVGDQAPRTIEHERIGAGWRKKGGERSRKGGAK